MRLKEERVRLGMNQTELGEVGGVRHVAQYRYEKGDRQPDSAYLSNIAAMGVDVQYVLTGKRSVSVLSVDESDLVASFRALDRRGQVGVLGLVNGMTPEPKITNKVTNNTMTFNASSDGVNMNGATFNEQVTVIRSAGERKKTR